MQLTKKLFGIITIMLIGFLTLPLIGCSEDDGSGGGSSGTTFTVEETSGRLTINGLSDYNGKYVMAMVMPDDPAPPSPPGEAMVMPDDPAPGEDENPSLFAAAQIYSTGTVKLGRVTNGSVTLKVWKITETAANNYTGNDKDVSVSVLIYNTETITEETYYEEDYGGTGGTGPAPETAQIAYAIGTVSFTNGVGTFTVEMVMDLDDNGGFRIPINVQETDGRLTINGLDDYNDKYVIAQVVLGGNERLIAVAQIGNDASVMCGKVEDGSVTLKVWKITYGMGIVYNNYTGNDKNVYVYVSIYNTDDIDDTEVAYGSGTVSFTNGVGTFTPQYFYDY